MLTTGMRDGEAAALMWQYVEWEVPGILIMHGINGSRRVDLPKNRDQRAVLIPKRTSELLGWWWDQMPYREPEHFVFSQADGRHFTISRPYRSRWRRRCCVQG